MRSPDFIKNIFEHGQGYARSKDLRAAGIDFYAIKKLLADGTVSQVKRGLYKWNSHPGAENDFPEVAKIVKEGILCLFSACHYYSLGDYIPYEHYVAVERHRRVRLPAYPPIKLYYWSQAHLEAGVQEYGTANGTFQMTDLEKTVCDMVKYRHKVGKDLLAKILRDYVQHPKRNLNQIMIYARIVRVEKMLANYLETLL